MTGRFDPLRHHGGRLSVARRQFPGALGPWVDLSTGISPWAYPVGAIPTDFWNRLPDPDDLAQLEVAAASAFGVEDPASLVAVPGSDLAIRLIAQVLQGRKAGLLAPIYSGHVTAWPDALPVTLDDTDTVDVLVCANPNNPDGRMIAPAKLRQFAGQLIVDEAFADAVPDASVLPDRDGAIVLRSFGKFYGLAGLRLGFVIADRAITQPLRALLGDWPVSGPATEIGIRAYRDTAWQHAQRPRLEKASARLCALLGSFGLEIVGGTPLFQLARHKEAAALFQTLGGAGILVRPFTELPEQLRFGLPASDTDLARLEQALTLWKAGL